MILTYQIHYCIISEETKEKKDDQAKGDKVDDKHNDIADEDDDDSWDKMFDDEGECLDPSAVEEVIVVLCSSSASLV